MTYGIICLHVNAGNKNERGYYNSQELGMARAMNRIGYSVVLFEPSGRIKEVSEELIEEGIRVVHLPSRSIGAHGFFDVRMLDNYALDAVQLCSDNQLFAPKLAKYLDFKGIPFFNYIGTIESKTNNILKRKLMRLLMRPSVRMFRKHKCFAKTPAVCADLVSAGVKDAEVLPVGLDNTFIDDYRTTCSKQDMQKQLGLPTDKRIIVYVSRMDATKRPEKVFELMSKLDDRYFLIMIGCGNLDSDIKDMIDSEAADDYRDRVLWIKKVPNTEIHKYYYASDYCVNMCLTEIFGMSILEAMYQGCTVLACHAPGPDYIIENGVTGYLVDSVDAMRELICADFLLDFNLLRDNVEKNYLWDSRAARVDEWIRVK